MAFQNIRKIIFTGPESTGKTTAALQMSKSSGLPMVYEYARTYLEENGPQYTMKDLYTILEGQFHAEEEAHAQGEIIICDTDWLTIDIWANEVFGKKVKPPYDIDERFYYLCPPDIPWEADPLRENPLDRERLYDLYVSKLLRFDLQYEILRR